jgi:hypothetical protein
LRQSDQSWPYALYVELSHDWQPERRPVAGLTQTKHDCSAIC